MMGIQGIREALQQAVQDGGTVLILDSWGVALLVALLAGAAAGWVLYLRSRVPGRGPARPAAEAAAKAVEPPREPPAGPPDPLESLFLRAAEGRPDGVILCKEGRVARAASEGTLLGRSPSSLEGLPFLDLVSAEDLLPAAEGLRSGTGLSDLRFGLRGPAGDGPRHVSARLLRPAGAARGDFVAVLTDTTEVTTLARAASSAARRIRSALEQVPYAVVLTSEVGDSERVSVANTAAGQLLGRDPAALPGMLLDDLRHQAAAVLPGGTAEALLPAAGLEGDARIQIPGDPPRFLERMARVLEGQGRVFIIRDVTALQTREEALRRAEREARNAWTSLDERQEEILMANEGLEKRIADFAELNRELKVIDEMKSNFLANVSHELQTPLVSIKGYTEMILKGRLGPLTEEQERGLRVALRNVDRLIGLIDSLLSFVRTEKDSEPLKVEVFSLRGMTEEVVELLSDRAAAKKIEMQVQFPSGDLLVRADRNRISQVFINLVGNAIKYNRTEGRVEIEAGRSSRTTARVEVRDTGEGIPREELDRIFERFYRASSARGEGSGLGLAIARDILRLHGCQIRADSEPGKGSVFSFTLPLEARGKSERAPRLSGTDREES